jgi:hypothetical protein
LELYAAGIVVPQASSRRIKGCYRTTMSFLYADLIGIDVHPLVLAREWTASRVRRTLEALTEVAESIGLGDVWSSACFFGADVGAEAAAATKGVTMGRACFPGVGFSREEDLRRAYPRSVDIVWGRHPLPPEAEKLRARLTSILTAHLKQLSAVMEVASAAWGARSLPVFVQVDIEAHQSYDFDEAYRRRLAYALGFAASLEAGSMAPYLTREEALLHGDLDDIVALCAGLRGFSALSIFANLLARLGGAAGLEVVQPSGRQPQARPVADPDRKQRWLESELRRSSETVLAELNEDGRAALAGLLREVECARQDGHYGRGRYPSWGLIATRDEYGLLSESG